VPVNSGRKGKTRMSRQGGTEGDLKIHPSKRPLIVTDSSMCSSFNGMLKRVDAGKND
jgi:hypothetical protein